MSDDTIPDPTSDAVSLFWDKRTAQLAALPDRGAAGGGARAGKHMNGIRELVASIFVEAGMPEEAIVREPYLPGYYRARKNWDLAVRYRGALVAAFEFKSQVGSVGKNISNRLEEALGAGTDAKEAQRKFEAFGDIPPWLGYVFVLEESSETEKAGRHMSALFPVDPAFHGMSYSQRYQEMIRRLMSDNVYQLGWFITTWIDDHGAVYYDEPLATATGKAFRAAVQGRVDYVRQVLG